MSTSIFSYVVRHDAGFSPNPFGQSLTLACCKPVIRRVAQIGDWILGFHTAELGHNLVCYAGRISETPDYDSYHRDPRFESKHPTPTNTGDAIYFRNETGILRQMQNRCHGLNEFAHDTQVDRMLICADFWYFGSQPKALPAQLFDRLHIGRGHRRTQDPDIIESLVAWLKGFPSGRLAGPARPLPGTYVEASAHPIGCRSSCPTTTN